MYIGIGWTIRQVDKHGRITLPVELRECLNIQKLDELQLSLKNGQLILTKIEIECCICESSNSGLRTFKERYICDTCRDDLIKLA
jgi:bifunctional DNA-binding transcriptional regulator/antitoxin component of YhaV-PrlF toxin-antitoxin module